ncbi:MAG: K(+)/H(+) antiporter NhaP2 [Acidimicrobiales bacterium]|nr:K(+)/H(+) antiporter NhaP2 [Acidimicrobiales bacterium]
MQETILTGLVVIVVLGVGGQWLARRIGVPSLLLLLPLGLLAGPVTDIVDNKEIFGNALFPVVSFAVAILLFGTGLRLRFDDLGKAGRRPVIRLITLGASITLAATTVAVLLLFDAPAPIALLTGAVLIVSGPTVIGPLLEAMHAGEPVRSVLNWESTTLDPIGAILGVAILNGIVAGDVADLHPALATLWSTVVGTAVGLAAAFVVLLALSRSLITDELVPAISLLFAVAAFGIADLIESESGLLAATVLGIVLANQQITPTRVIQLFGEQLEVLITGSLFIVLGANISPSQLEEHAWQIAILVAILVMAVRPLAVAAATARTSLSWREKATIGWAAPRGIVAAATSSQFALTLQSNDIEGGETLTAVVFGVIMGAGIVYGLTTPLVARRTGVALPSPQGVVLIGSDPWLVDLARQLGSAGADAALLTSDYQQVEVRADGYHVHPRILDRDQIGDFVADNGIGTAIVASRNDAHRALATALFIELLGRGNVFELPTGDHEATSRRGLLGRFFKEVSRAGSRPFLRGSNLTRIDEAIGAGARVATVTPAEIGPDDIRLALIERDGKVVLSGAAQPSADARLIAVVPHRPR